MSNYREWLASKLVRPAAAGFEADTLCPHLFDWQAAVVRWALRQGRAAIFADCGLGKTLMQLAWADQVARHSGRPVLILTPLAVGPQTVSEAARFGLSARLVRPSDDTPAGVCVCNYQKILDPSHRPWLQSFGGVVLDESSILKSFMGKTKRMLCDAFADTPYRLACTATPSPNDRMELGNHSEFLGVMPANEMLTRWFINDQGDGAGNYRLKGHAEEDYWRWVCSWAVCVSSPSDLGFPDDGYKLPPLETVQHVVAVDETEGAGDGRLFRDDSLTATSVHREMRRTAAARAECVAALVNASDELWVVWCNTNYEADELRRRLKDCVEVRGNERDEAKERKLADFAEGRTRVLLSKPSICGFGLNWQHCRNVAFVGLSYSQEQYYQAVRRVWRFGQRRPVRCHVVVAATEGEVLAAIQRKERDQEGMRGAMRRAMRQTIESPARAGGGLGLAEVKHEKAEIGDAAVLHLGDCVEVSRTLPDASADLCVFSPPFAGLYIYSASLADMGNSADDAEFFRHFGYLVPELYRVTVPGRLCVVHCKDLPLYANQTTGGAGLRPFPDEIVRLFLSHGWKYHSRVTVWKCPVVERERTNRCALLHASVKRDSSQVGQGLPDYLLVFRRPVEGEDLRSDRPIERPEGLDGFVGDPVFDPRQNRWHPSPHARKKEPGEPSIAVWQRYADPVWWDIDPMDVLNEKLATESKDEKHICPLQLGLIRRVVRLWSLPGDVVFTPFLGVGSEAVVALEERRRAVGIELKRSYWQQACRFAAAAAEKARQRGLFDQVEEGAA